MQITWKIHALLSRLAHLRIKKNPALYSAIVEYQKVTESTGAKWTTIQALYDGIINSKPKAILECGTGLTTVVMIEAIRRLQEADRSYKPVFHSLESEEYYFDHALKILPNQYRGEVEILYRPRELYQTAFYRGYVYKDKPDIPYDFIFIDGPSYQDERGATFCADAVQIYEKSGHAINGVIDTRVTSAYVMQQLFGSDCVSYSPLSRVATFALPTGGQMNPKLRSEAFSRSVGGRLKISHMQ